MADVIDLASRRRAPASAPAYAPGVPAFDPANPAHVRAWNALVALGRSKTFPGERA